MRYCTHFGFGLALGATSLFALVPAATAFAAEKNLPAGASHWLSLDNCAAYGPGFTSVEGTNTCVRIGGHVRVEFGSHGQGFYPTSSGTGTTAAAIRTDVPASGSSDLPEPRHLRVNTDDSGYLDPFR